MKTAIQQLIEKLEELRDLHPSDGGLNQRVQRGKYVFAILEAKTLLETEKQQIIEAAKHGANFDISPYMSADDYFDKTFNQ